MRGAGHFTFWFLIGHLAFIWLHQCHRRNRQVLLWGPFLPFLLGSVAVFPYLLQLLGIASRETALSTPFLLFLLYPITEQSQSLQRSFGNFHLNAVLVSLVYLHLVHHYLRLIRHLSRSARRTS